MAEKIVEKSVCEQCGADVREGTTFCYNCGGQIASVQSVDNSPIKEKAEESTREKNEKFSRAAEQRRKARVVQRKSNEYTWEATENSNLTLVIAVLITVVALAIAFLAVHWK